MTLVALTSAQIATGLISHSSTDTNGGKWPYASITYSIPTSTSVWTGYTAGSEPFDSHYGILSASLANQFRAAIAIWDSYIPVSLVEVADNASGSGNIRVAFFDEAAGSWGHALFPPHSGLTSDVLPQSGDIWIDYTVASQDFTGTNLESLLHEIGHALGLEHPFSGSTDYLSSPYQNTLYTIMSYTDATNFYVTWTRSGNSLSSSYQGVYASTPMVLDIAAIQQIYGQDPNTNAGDTTWSFRGQGDVYLNGTRDATWPYVRTIYDAAGSDTFDLTQMTRHSVVDLRPGSYSSIGLWSAAEQLAYYQSLYPTFGLTAANFVSNLYTGDNNFGISFSTMIEKINLSNYGDTVIANDVGDTIHDGTGADTITGGAGPDIIYALTGRDAVSAGIGNDTVYITDLSGTPNIASVDGGAGADLLYIQLSGSAAQTINLTSYLSANAAKIVGFEFYSVIGSAGADTMTGTSAPNHFWGNGGNDVIDGGVGTDQANYSNTMASYTVSTANGVITVADKTGSRDGTDTLTNIEQVAFTDITLVYDLTSSQDLLVYKLYQASFARTPDNGGYRYWAGVADATGMSALALADAFLAAPEFAQKYGASPSNTAYATAMYTNVLGRAPDQAGLDYWVGNLVNGESRDQLLVDFAKSQENAVLVGTHTANGYWTTTTILN